MAARWQLRLTLVLVTASLASGCGATADLTGRSTNASDGASSGQANDGTPSKHGEGLIVRGMTVGSDGTATRIAPPREGDAAAASSSGAAASGSPASSTAGSGANPGGVPSGGTDSDTWSDELLSDGTIDDGADPFDAILRMPPAESLPMPAPAELPDIDAPDATILDDRDVQGAEHTVMKIYVDTCGGRRLGSGSGWVAAPELVVTNVHVIAGAARRPRVQIGGEGFKYPAMIVAMDVAADVAVLRVPGLPTTPFEVVWNPAEGTSAAILGFPHGGRYHMDPVRLGPEVIDTSGQFDGFLRPVAQRVNQYIAGHAAPGNSGGPMVDDQGRVVGTVWGTAPEVAPPGLALGVPQSATQQAVAAARSAGTNELDPGPCVVPPQ